MADRPARIRLMLESGSFLGGMQQVGNRVKSISSAMGAALRSATEQGLHRFGAGMSSLAGQAKQLGTMALGIGGGVGIVGAAKEAIELEGNYRSLANQINRLKDTGKDWHDVQAMIEAASEKSGIGPEKLAAAFKEVYSATGDLKYSEKAVKAIGTAARATGEDTVALAMPMQLAMRKFGVSADEAEEAVARIIEKVGVGGASLESMNMRFASMAGEAAEAGMRGKEGMTALLGVMLELDSRVGEKASWGLKSMFQYLKDGTTYVKQFQKQAGIKFEADTSALDKLRKIVGSEKGRKTAELVFTTDSRVVYDQIVKPFQTAYKEAKEAGKSTKEATKAGYEAYDAAMARMTESTAKFSKLQDQATERLKNDPAAVLEKAVTEFKRVFTQPEMMHGLERMAKALPPVVEGLGRLISWTSKNPWEGATALVTGLIVKDIAAAGLGMAIKRVLLAAMPRAPVAPALPAPATPMAPAAAATAGAAAAVTAYVGGAVAAGTAGYMQGKTQAKMQKLATKQGYMLQFGPDYGPGAGGMPSMVKMERGISTAREIVEARRAEQRGPEIQRETGPRAFPMPITTSRRTVGPEREVESSVIRAQQRATGEDVDARKDSARAARELTRDIRATGRELRQLVTPKSTNGLPPNAPRAPGYAER